MAMKTQNIYLVCKINALCYLLVRFVYHSYEPITVEYYWCMRRFKSSASSYHHETIHCFRVSFITTHIRNAVNLTVIRNQFAGTSHTTHKLHRHVMSKLEFHALSQIFDSLVEHCI